jgi:hypothetical protein
VQAAETPAELPARIELLETRVRFEANGDSRKEVHTRVHINNELGAGQFARLAFDYNRSFQQVEFPLVRVTHSGGGTADILPSAISDQPNPAVVDAPAYQDVRVKSIRILGLAPSDTLEYRVVTTTSHHPLAPDFWLDHTFDRSGVTANEIFEVDFPTARKTQIHISPDTPPMPAESVGQVDEARSVYKWRRAFQPGDETKVLTAAPDVVLTTFDSWRELADRLDSLCKSPQKADDSVAKKAVELTRTISDRTRKAEGLYDFVAQRIRTIDLSPGSTGFRSRSAAETLSSGYGTQLDKIRLLEQLRYDQESQVHTSFFASTARASQQLPLPSFLLGSVAAVFIYGPHAVDASAEVAQGCDHCGRIIWIDPEMEVAPYGMTRPELHGKTVLFLGFLPGQANSADPWRRISDELPFPASQRVRVDASLANDGTLKAKVGYTMRGDNELILRVAFHQAPREKWNEVAQLLALSDGFRGKITNVSASDPYSTKEPFTVEYEITQPKFVDWSKKPVRIPALLPQVALPDLSSRTGADSPAAIDLGTPLDVQTHLTLHLPPGTAARMPTGTSVARDYATFVSKYEVNGTEVTASRRLNFLLREIAADRAGDYSVFVNAVRGDEAQKFTLDHREDTVAPKSASASGTKKN